MKKKITFFDKIFSFRESIVRQYIENELSDYIDKIDFKKDVIKRHWMFFFIKSFSIFIFIWIFSTLLFFLIKYQHIISNIFEEWNFWINILIWASSFFIIFWFIIYIIKAKFINKIWIFIWFFLSIINIFLTIPEKISVNFILETLFQTASLLLFILFLEVILKSLKIIYDILIDYKNDFLIIYPEGIYISEKEWALRHESQRIMFDEIVDVQSREKWLIWTYFWFWKLTISIMWTWSDYVFRYCKNIERVPTQLHEKRIAYNKRKKMTAKKEYLNPENSKNLEIQENRNEINIVKCKPFKSRIRDDLIKILNLK